MKLLIDTNDLDLIKNIEYVLKNTCQIYKNKARITSLNTNYQIYIFDNLVKERVLAFLDTVQDKDDCLIVNISGAYDIENNVVNIKTPFRLVDLIEKIRHFIEYYNKNIKIINHGIINFDKKTYRYSDKSVVFTEKENNLIHFIIEHKHCTKNDIINSVWGREDENNSLIEGSIYNIRQKLRENNLEDFFIIENNNYNIKEEENED